MRFTHRTVLVFLAVIAVSGPTIAAAAGKPKVYPIPKPTLPSAREGCNAGKAENGATTIPIAVGKVRELVEPLINVCFGGKGPYPMLIDTGAADSAISISLAEELGLKKEGAPGKSQGAGCIAKTQDYGLPGWSVGGVELEGGLITAVDAPEKGKGYARGSLGADVLSRFGAARLDFRAETLTLVGEEGPMFTGSEKSAKTPGALLQGKPKLTVPMAVQAGSGEVIQTVRVGVGQTKPQPWLIDTGASYSFIDSALVKQAKLTATGTAQKGSTYCSVITVPEFKATSLPLSSGKLKPQTVGSFEGLKEQGAAGILGSYSLWQFGSVVFDWSAGKLLLGVG